MVNRLSRDKIRILGPRGQRRTAFGTYVDNKHQLDFSPDGRQIAYFQENGDGAGGVKVVNRSTKTVRSLIPGGQGMYPVWSPDGQRIALLLGNGIYSVRASDGGDRRLIKSFPVMKAVGVMDWRSAR